MILALWFATLMPSRAEAQQGEPGSADKAAPAPGGLRATPLVKDLHLRKDAPIPLEVQLSFAGPGLLEGRLEATLLHAGGRAGMHRSTELVVAPGQRTVSLLLPPPPRVKDGDPVGLRLRWLAQGTAYDLGEARLGIYGLANNELILAVVRTGERQSEFELALERSLAIEHFQPDGPALGWRAFNTVPVSLALEHLPGQPLGWCSYDGVLLSSRALGQMGEKLLDALTRWIEAGGSVFVCGDATLGGALKDHQLQFLNHFAGEGMSFRIEDGRLACSGGGSPGPLCLTAGLGRVVVELDPPRDEAGLRGKPWAKAAGWFWRVRPRDQAEMERTGRWSKWAVRGPERFAVEQELAYWLWSSAIGYDVLSPDKPRPLPLGLVALLLGTLLLAVGPVDWLVLGWLRRRRWTWGLLPICCLASAWGASQLAARTIGRTDRSGQVVITDVGADGRVLRQCRFDMLLPARDREWAVAVRQGLATPFAGTYLLAEEWVDVPDLDDSTGEWTSEALFTSRRNLRQWTPVMTQSTSFPGGVDETGIPWDKLVGEWAGTKPAELTRTTFSSQGWTVLFGHLAHPASPPMAADQKVGELEQLPKEEQVRVDGVIPDKVRMNYRMASTLLSLNALAEPRELFSHRSPSISGIAAAIARPPAPLVALAWREGPHEMEIVRRIFLAKP